MQHTYALLFGSRCATGLSDLADCFESHTFTLISSLQTEVGIVHPSVNVLLHPAMQHCLSASFETFGCKVPKGFQYISQGSHHARLAVCKPCS